jgi:hypothetical protein
MAEVSYGQAWIGGIVLILAAGYLFYAWKAFKWPFQKK